MLRRSFIDCAVKGTVGILSTVLFAKAFAEEDNADFNITKVRIEAGLKKPLKFLHISDLHMAICDERDPKSLPKAHGRNKLMRNPQNLWKPIVQYAKKRNMPLLCTGDILDFGTQKGYEFLKESVAEDTYVFSSGNHEYFRWVNPAPEYNVKDVIEKTKACFKYDLEFSSHIVGGLNIISIDNANMNFTPRQYELYLKEVQRGLPIIILCHTPLYTQKFYEQFLSDPENKSPNLCATPVEKLQHLAEKFNNKGVLNQRASAFTEMFAAQIKREKLVKGVLCGHLHMQINDTFESGAVQTCADAAFKKELQEITIC